MEPFRYHVYICEQQKPDGVPCCAARGASRVIEALRREIGARGLFDEVQITTCGSLGLCERGPNMVVYPDGVWYSGITPEDVPEIVERHFLNGQVVERLANRDEAALKAEVVANRDRFLAGQRAREAAGVMPDPLQQTIRGFMESRVVLTALELNLFTALGDGATAAQAAAALKTDARATAMLLNALVSLGLATKQDDVFRTTPLSARYFVDGSQDSARMATLHTANLWATWSTLTAAVRAGASVYQRNDSPPWIEAFIAAMHRNAADRAPAVVRAVGVEDVRRMLDVGGGSGAYSIAFARENPHLRVEILDHPPVLAIAQRHIAEANLADRIATRPGDLTADAFGTGYDLVFLSAICHMLGPQENLDLFRRSRAALGKGGRIVVQDFILDPDKTGPRFAALFSLNMLVGTRAGASYNEDEYTGWLREAGFADVRRIPLPGPAHLITGIRR